MVFRYLMKMLKDNSHARSTFDVQKCGNKFVIGIGFGRTGTTSLHVALQQLGFNSYHSSVVAENPQDHSLWNKAADLKKTKLIGNDTETFNHWYNSECQLNGTVETQNEFNWEDIFQSTTTQKYNATIGPSLPFSMDILQFYEGPPYNYDVKVILTQRDADKWYQSIMGSLRNVLKIMYGNLLLKQLAPYTSLHVMAKTQFGLIFDIPLNKLHKGLDDEMKMKQKYIEWNKSVIDNIPSHKLLIFDVCDGWQPLCHFLDVDVPETEFPRSNEAKDIAKVVTILRIINICANGMVFIVVGKVFLYLIDFRHINESETEVSVM